MLSVLISLTGCGSENSKPEPAPKENQTKQVEEKPVELVKEKTPEQIVAEERAEAEKQQKLSEEENARRAIEREREAAIPSKISNLPGLGATRSEFEKSHKQNATYLDGYRVGYDHDQFIVDFGDAQQNPSKAKNARVISMTFQPDKSNRAQGVNIDDYLPSDAYDIRKAYDMGEFTNDEMVMKDYIAGSSEILAKLYPEYDGHFSVTMVYNRQTQEFLYATFVAWWIYDL